MSTLHVALADAPTDVLVHLVDDGPATISGLATALAPPDTASPVAVVSYAIDLLRRLGYVKGHSDGGYKWAATVAGVDAVADARVAAAEVAS